MLVLLYQGPVHTLARLVFALGLGLLMLGFALHERQQPLAWPALMLALGNASFSIYLVHNPLLSLTQRVLGGLEWSWALALFSGIAIAICCGYGYWMLVEAPALRYLRARESFR